MGRWRDGEERTPDDLITWIGEDLIILFILLAATVKFCLCELLNSYTWTYVGCLGPWQWPVGTLTWFSGWTGPKQLVIHSFGLAVKVLSVICYVHMYWQIRRCVVCVLDTCNLYCCTIFIYAFCLLVALGSGSASWLAFFELAREPNEPARAAKRAEPSLTFSSVW